MVKTQLLLFQWKDLEENISLSDNVDQDQTARSVTTLSTEGHSVHLVTYGLARKVKQRNGKDIQKN